MVCSWAAGPALGPVRCVPGGAFLRFVACDPVGVPGAGVLCRAGLLCVLVGGGPPASRPRRELCSARRLEARPGPATAHGHRSLARGRYDPDPPRTSSCLSSITVEAATSWLPKNVARNSPASISNFEFTSLELQRFRVVSKNDRGKLRATFVWGQSVHRSAARRSGALHAGAAWCFALPVVSSVWCFALPVVPLVFRASATSSV